MQNTTQKLIRACLYLILTALMVFSCNKDNYVDERNSVSLTAPNGIAIANSIIELSNIVENHFIPSNISYNKVKITKVEYLDIPKYAVSALVSYQIDNMPISNYGLFKNFENMNSKSKGLNSAGAIIMRCVANGNCVQSSCLIEGTIDLNTGTQTAKCSCAECILETTIE